MEHQFEPTVSASKLPSVHHPLRQSSSALNPHSLHSTRHLTSSRVVHSFTRAPTHDLSPLRQTTLRPSIIYPSPIPCRPLLFVDRRVLRPEHRRLLSLTTRHPAFYTSALVLVNTPRYFVNLKRVRLIPALIFIPCHASSASSPSCISPPSGWISVSDADWSTGNKRNMKHQRIVTQDGQSRVCHRWQR